MSTPCVACADREGGCERCRGGPGEQGFSLDEQELLQLRDRVRSLEAETKKLKGELAETALFMIPTSMAKAAARDAADLVRHKLLDAVIVGFAGDPRATLATEAALRELVRRLR